MADQTVVSASKTPDSNDMLSGEQYRRLVEAVTEYAIYMLDADGRVATWNTGAQRIKGYRSDEIIGRHFSVFFTPEDIAAGKPMKALETARKGGRFEDEGWRCRRDGTRFWAMAVLDAIRDDDGTVVGFAKITRDITARREAHQHLEKTREELFQSQKLEALGRLTGGVAHDFNNLLAAILSGLSLIERRTGDDEKVARTMATLRQAVERGRGLTGHLLSFSRGHELKPQPILIQERIAEVLRLVEQTLGGNIRVVSKLDPALPPVMVDLDQFELAVLNICLNARDAMPDGGTLTVTTAKAPGDGNGGTGSHSGPHVVLEISDTGVGMPADVLSRIFEPFFTTKDVDKGSGLGLSQAYGFVEQSGGSIDVDSTPGAGTTMTLRLPVSRVLPDGEQTEAPAPRADGEETGCGRVLLVEDDPALAEVTSDLLGECGYTVEVAGTGPAALDILHDRPPFDVVLTDVIMPGGLTGLDLAKRIREEFPSLPIILTTGVSRRMNGKEGLENIALLNKPYRSDSLLKAMNEAIARNRAGSSAPGNPSGPAATSR